MHAALSWNLCVLCFSLQLFTRPYSAHYFLLSERSFVKPLLIGLFFMGQTQPFREFFI